MRLCIDLCSGLGGFSQAFEDDPDWEVITVEINPKFKPTIVADVCHLPLRENLKPDALLMSPPCERFSIANPKWPQKGIGKALAIVGACMDAVVWLKPSRWILENPKGRLRWFLGNPPQTIRYSDHDLNFRTNKLTDFWGNVPLPMIKENRIYARKGRDWFVSVISRSPSVRAQIPIGVSRAVKQGVEVNSK